MDFAAYYSKNFLFSHWLARTPMPFGQLTLWCIVRTAAIRDHNFESIAYINLPVNKRDDALCLIMHRIRRISSRILSEDSKYFLRSVVFHIWRIYDVSISDRNRTKRHPVFSLAELFCCLSKCSWSFICWKYFSCSSCRRQVPWHGLGIYIQNAPYSKDAGA